MPSEGSLCLTQAFTKAGACSSRELCGAANEACNLCLARSLSFCLPLSLLLLISHHSLEPALACIFSPELCGSCSRQQASLLDCSQRLGVGSGLVPELDLTS